ncbi:nuclear transport factor 2 family protein [Paraconexibacter sp. AEG42_29]
MAAITLPEAVEQFVTRTNAHDVDVLLAVFAPEATVGDDGKTYTTEAEIRGWIQSHLIDPKVVLTPTAYEGDRMIASGDGDFPGGPLPFAFDFAIQDGLITRLAIEAV